jgi:hypothetical protein
MLESTGEYITKIKYNEYVSSGEYRRQWKKVLGDTLKELGFIENNYNGQIVVNISQGGVSTVQQNKHIS